ncbi:uncharacterized protein LOC122576879 isoform X4 [Bombus pyrosoma]|uniref:uncharacterized protein LOC122576879 isoform X4 n=1 Tax=Bombus pyrosoma TaxID=396416 RepID=UPI001CB8AA07|nr:uncharacterized protein LOC122576879 isoform X4 [Bombus pyrosoma]
MSNLFSYNNRYCGEKYRTPVRIIFRQSPFWSKWFSISKTNVENLGFWMRILNKLGTDERTSELSHLRTNELLATSPVVTLYQRSLFVFGTTAGNRVGVLLALRNATNPNALELS